MDLQDKNFSGEKINNIIDLQFLEGYYEPTLLILYEPIRTWSGRLAVRQDTCAMIALSLNVHQRVHPIIWSTNNLPFDSQYVLSVPRPIGGVLIFCTNILIYLNQSVPPFAVSLNSFTDSSSAFPLQSQKNIKISLDCSRACFLNNDKLVISLKDGEIYVVTLFIDRMRSVKRFHFEKAASTVISSCITQCGKEFLFLGSRLGNSLLLKYAEKIVNIQSKLFDEKIAGEQQQQQSASTKQQQVLTNGLQEEEEVAEEEKEEALVKNDDGDNEKIKERMDVDQRTSDALENQSELNDDKSNQEVISFVNDNLDKNEFFKENEFIFEEQSTELNYKKRKIDILEFDDEDKELYGDDDPIFQNENINSNQLNNNNNNNEKEKLKLNIILEDSNDLYDESNSNEQEEKQQQNKQDEEELNDKENNDNEINLTSDCNQLIREEDNEEENLKNLLNDSREDDNLEMYDEAGDFLNQATNNNNDNQSKENSNDNEQQLEEENTPIADWMAGDVALLKDAELEIFSSEENDKLPITLVFEVCDSILNIGPCSRFCMGELSFLAEELEKEDEHQIELVTTSGYGKNGALCVLQRTIRPQIVTTFVLPKCLDMWTVYSLQKDIDFAENATNDLTHHAYLILSRSDSTMILQTGQEINELDQHGFICSSKTILAGNLYNNKYIIQISSNSIRLIEGVKQVKNFPLDLGFPIVSASLADPHCIVMTENGTLIHLHLSLEANAPKLTLVKLDFPEQKAKIIACSLYKDKSGLFVTKIKNVNEQKSEINRKQNKSTNNNNNSESAKMVFKNNNEEIDDLDELLYGDSDVNAIVGATIKNPKTTTTSEEDTTALDDPQHSTSIKQIAEQMSTYWLFLTREDGSLEIYSIPDITLVYKIDDFALAPLTLIDTTATTASLQQTSKDQMLQVNEIFIGGFGVKQSRPLLFVRFSEEVCVYETFRFTENEIDNHLKIRFNKLNSTLFLNEPETIELDVLKYKKYFRPFTDISGYNGLFVCGSLPHWFFMSDRGELRLHEMSIDGYIPTFSSFNNINCPKGFLYFNDKEELRIAILPTHLTYDSSWLARKVPTKCTVHFIKYHVINKCYVVITSALEEYRKIAKLGGEDKDFECLERDERYIWPTTEKFSIQLFSPVSWEMIAGTRIDLDDWEHVTCLQSVMLQTEGTETGFKGFVALGTNYCYGEDVTNKGRIMILDIVEVVPEPGQPLTKNKIKVAYSKEQKGPVTALTQVRGYLLSTIGQKIYIWQLKEDQLAGVAFIDTQIYIHSAVSIKNLILVADYYKSISLLRYQEETKTLALVSKDTRSFEVYACEFLVDNNLLCFIVSDADKNLILYHYQPEIRESNGGTRLIQRGDFHIGSRINHFFRIRCKKSRHCTEEQNKENIAKQLTMYATLDGSMGMHFLIAIIIINFIEN